MKKPISEERFNEVKSRLSTIRRLNGSSPDGIYASVGRSCAEQWNEPTFNGSYVSAIDKDQNYAAYRKRTEQRITKYFLGRKR